MKSRKVLVPLIVVAALTACGGGGGGSSSGSAKDQAYVDALVNGLEKDANDGGTGFKHEENVCIAEGIVEIIGSKAFEDAGIQPSDLTDNTDTTLPDVSDAQHEDLRSLLFDGDCVDMTGTIADSFKGSVGSGTSSDQITCLAEAVVADEAMQNFIVDGLLGRDTTDSASSVSDIVQSAAADCGITG